MRRSALVAATALPALAATALLVPAVLAPQGLLPAAVARALGAPATAPRPVAVTAAAPPPAATGGWHVSVWPPRPGLPYSQTDPLLGGHGSAPFTAPGAPPRPLRPALPWTVPPGTVAGAVPTPPPLVLGPVQHLVASVGEAGAAVLPPAAGAPAGAVLPHVLCAGPTTPLASYYLDTSDGTARVRRWDRSGAIDVYFRYVSDAYVQRQPCA